MEHIKKALQENLDAFVHEAEEAGKIGYGKRVIEQTIHKGMIVGVKEISREISWKRNSGA